MKKQPKPFLGKVPDLLRVYQDLEKTLKGLKQLHKKSASTPAINVAKLINQLSVSKKRLERKISNTLLIERDQLKRRWRTFASGLSKDN